MAANTLVDEIRRACGAEKLPWDRGLRLGTALVNDLTPVVRRMLGGLQREPERLDEAEAAWKIVARRLAWAAAEPVLAATPPTAFLGRRESERVVHRLSLAESRYRRSITAVLGPIHIGQPDAPLAESGASR
jgi:CRISPR system Cascade subunit CasA